VDGDSRAEHLHLADGTVGPGGGEIQNMSAVRS
jgi:hypothetical protein